MKIELNNQDNELNFKIDQAQYQKLSMRDWRVLLANEVDVYVYNNSYIAKRFDDIQYEFCSLKEAQEILEDNIYALLKYKYFPLQNDNIDKLITKIVKSFNENIKTTLIKISFEWEQTTNNKIIKDIPINCIAFRNGVYDFKNNKWLFKIYKQPLDNIQNVRYAYDKDYIILWYIDIDFQSLDIDINKTDSLELKNMFYKTTSELDNLAFNLVYNMSFNDNNEFSIQKFEHLCQILGFTLSTQFIQSFVMFIGNGSNGKNSLLDGCFSSKLIPKPASISLDSIEEDKFVTGALENKYHNFFLESTGKTYHRTEMLKALTGSTQHSIERKGENKRTGYINVKHIFSGNDREKIKFGDSTNGFIRRINLYEVFYSWDSRGDYLKLGKYLKTNISPDLRELKFNIINTITYIYLGMWGMSKATKNFTEPFYFGYNDYNIKYENIDSTIRKTLSTFSIEDVIKMILKSESEVSFFIDGKRLYMHKMFKLFFKLNEEDNWKNCVNNEELLIEFLEDKDVYINLNKLREYVGSSFNQTTFNQEVIKYSKQTPTSYYNNQKYVKIKFIGRRIKFTK